MENKLYKNETNNREELTQENYNICRNIQRKMVRSNLIPKDLKPSKEVYEELGFRFYPYLEDENMYFAILPDDWKLEASNSPLWTKIIDENNNTRGLIYYNPTQEKISASLRSRYGIHTRKDDLRNTTLITVYFGTEDEELHIVGQFATTEDEERTEFLTGALENIAKDYAERKYPNWTDVRYYWGPKERQYTK